MGGRFASEYTQTHIDNFRITFTTVNPVQVPRMRDRHVVTRLAYDALYPVRMRSRLDQDAHRFPHREETMEAFRCRPNLGFLEGFQSFTTEDAHVRVPVTNVNPNEITVHQQEGIHRRQLDPFPLRLHAAGVAPTRGMATSLGRLPVGRENPMRGKTHPPYDPEFRKRAVQLVITQGLSKQQVADDLGCSYESLRNWVKQHEIDEGKRQGPSTAELDELRSLRRENKILREEREILRKAAAFFARETMS